MKKLSVLLAMLMLVSVITCSPVSAQEPVQDPSAPVQDPVQDPSEPAQDPEEDSNEDYVIHGKHRCTVTVVEPTCKKKGKKIYKCVDCGKKITECIEKAAHTEVKSGVASTYFKEGYKNKVTCSVCGKVLKKGKPIDKLKLPKVKILSVKTVACDTVKIKWEKVKAASGYLLYKKEKGAKDFKQIQKVKGTNSAKVSGLICGKKYVFQVKAYICENKKTVTSQTACKKDVVIDFSSINKFEIKTSQYCFPLEGDKANVTSLYGWRYLNGYKDWHNGVDIAGDTGDKLMAFKSGVVSRIYYEPYGWGNYVLIYHGKVNGKEIYSGYAHLSKICVKKGDKVVQGDKIGEVGNTGHSFGSHLHFEIYKGGNNPAQDRVNPMGYLNLKAEKGWQKVR